MRRWLRIITRILRYGIPLVFYVLFAYKNRETSSRIRRFRRLQYYFKNIDKCLDIELHVTGLENLPNEQSFMITPNHQSMVDGTIMFEIFNDPIQFVSKGELEKIPVAKQLLAVMGSIFMNRGSLKEELKVMKRVRKSLLEDNAKWIIFPEGTRTTNENYRLNEFKAGTYKFPMSIDKKVIPCAIHGTARVLDGKVNLKKYPIYIHFFKPFTKEDYKILSTQEIAFRCQNMIQQKLEEFIEIDKKIIKNY